MADVRFDHVYKRYGENPPVITDLNLHIQDHEFLVLVGPSGCGKSTALRMIAGLEEISEGSLYIGDRAVNDVAPKDRDIAMVFQNYALYPHMSVFDNMAFSLKLRGTPKEEIATRVNRAADMLGITDYLPRKPKALSGGQRQRVALGRALVREPKVFLLDEPLSNLDAKLRVATRTEIARLHQTTKTTFVYVTHDQVEAMTMGDRIAVLNAGLIQQLGTPQELYDRPANLFVAGFIGSPAMDFFDGLIKRAGDGATLTIGGRTLTLAGQSAAAAANAASSGERKVVAGIRPEDFRLATEADPNTLLGTVDVVEHLGNEQLIYMQSDGARSGEHSEVKAVTARIAPDAIVRHGERVAITFDPTRVHLFDAETGKRL
ncbi:MAG TPA: sn-glycerol-3-phosphate ABC transporter ATP-binding protein UgpC [Ktedonobacterales bacterium]|nr:sn-glycerol-3-phosphate ABC transporter ATP-binding protein UgpC [Ktedonobacterales bacterium]